MAYSDYGGTIPNRATQDGETLSANMDDWVAWFTPNAADLADDMAAAATDADDAETAKTAAEAAQTAAEAAQALAEAAVTQVSDEWVSGASYTEGDLVWSPVNHLTYRAATTHSGESTDPSADGTNWTDTTNADAYATADQGTKADAAMPKAGGDFTGAVSEKAVSLTGTTPTLDCGDGNSFYITTSGNTTITLSSAPSSGQEYVATLEVAAGGSHTLALSGGTIETAGGEAMETPASGETNIYTIRTRDGGTTWLWSMSAAGVA